MSKISLRNETRELNLSRPSCFKRYMQNCNNNNNNNGEDDKILVWFTKNDKHQGECFYMALKDIFYKFHTAIPIYTECMLII